MTKLISLFIYLTVLFITCEKLEDTDIIENDAPGEVAFKGIFNSSFNSSEWRKAWGIPWFERPSGCDILPGSFNGDYAMRISFPKGAVGPSKGGTQFPVVFADGDSISNSHFTEFQLRYHLKFEEGFDFRMGGKLPGLMGGRNSWTRSGGSQPDGTNGWTLRFMWSNNGNLVVYAYIPHSGNGKWGGTTWGQVINCNFRMQPGKWHQIDQYVNVGTPGKDDGKLIIWVDGKQKLYIDDMRFWTVDNEFGRIGGIYFSTFHGGNTSDWAPLNDSFIRFAGLTGFTFR